MANTVSNSDGETESFVSEARVPLLGLPLEDAEAGLAPIRADEGSKELPSIIQTKNAHETTVGNLYIRPIFPLISSLKLLQSPPAATKPFCTYDCQGGLH